MQLVQHFRRKRNRGVSTLKGSRGGVYFAIGSREFCMASLFLVIKSVDMLPGKMHDRLLALLALAQEGDVIGASFPSLTLRKDTMRDLVDCLKPPK